MNKQKNSFKHCLVVNSTAANKNYGYRWVFFRLILESFYSVVRSIF